jgi:hypothetical protein
MFTFFGLRDNLPVGPDGFGRATAFIWQRTLGPFVTGSTDPDVLADVTPQFRIARAERPAQLWLQLGDLNHSNLATLINGFGYFRARQITGGDLRFIQRVSSQLGVPTEKAKAAAEDLIGGRLVCALGGEFKLGQTRGGTAEWYSTAWDRDASRLITSVPRGFTTPPLDWLMGADIEAGLTPEMLTADGLLTMQRRAPATATAPTTAPSSKVEASLPAFPFGGLDWFGGKKDPDKKESDKKAAQR